MRGDELSDEVLARYRLLVDSDSGLSGHGAATLVLAAELRGLRKDLRSAQAADLTALVEAFREEAPAQRGEERCPGCGCREGYMHEESCPEMAKQQQEMEDGPGVMAECTVCGEYRRCLDGICRDCDPTPESG